MFGEVSFIRVRIGYVVDWVELVVCSHERNAVAIFEAKTGDSVVSKVLMSDMN